MNAAQNTHLIFSTTPPCIRLPKKNMVATYAIIIFYSRMNEQRNKLLLNKDLIYVGYFTHIPIILKCFNSILILGRA